MTPTIAERLTALETGLDALGKHIDFRFDALDKALILRTAELERRLHDLDGTTGRVRLLELAGANLIGKATVIWGGILLSAGTIAMLIINWFKK